MNTNSKINDILFLTDPKDCLINFTDILGDYLNQSKEMLYEYYLKNDYNEGNGPTDLFNSTLYQMIQHHIWIYFYDDK